MAHIKFLALLFVLSLVSLGVTRSKPTRRYRYDAEFLDSEIQRIRSGRAEHDADPIWSPSKSTLEAKKEGGGSQESDDTERESEEGSASGSTSEDYGSTSEEIDVTCAPGKGWHLRGRRCVLLNCPGGPAERDFNTGECLYSSSSQQPRGRFNRPFQQWNDLNHVYRSSPMSTHFVRSMVLMRKG